MGLHQRFYIFGFVFLLCFLFNCTKEKTVDRTEQGLIGAYYGNADLTHIKLPEVLPDLDRVWDEALDSGHGSSWSGKYEGFIIAPFTGEVTFELETNREASLEINGKKVSAKGEQTQAVFQMTLKKDERYPITAIYMHTQPGRGYMRITWSWDGQEKTTIPAERLFFTAEQAEYHNFVIEPDPATIDKSKFKTVPVKHVMVFNEPGRFGGWPANNGIWIWENEIVVGLISGYYRASDMHHSIVKEKPMLSLLARSLDGGETWSIEDPENYIGDDVSPAPQTGDINFAHPDFAMRCGANQFYISYDRCKTWQGFYQFPDFGREKLTPRTDYIVNGDKNCLFFLSTEEEEKVQAQLQDWTFCVQTTDGGKTFQFLSWMAEPNEVRAVMPSTVRVAENHLISAMRRRHDKPFPNRPPKQQNWIDVYESIDNGKSWTFLSKVADTDRGKRNGNPPSLVKLSDGRLCVTYGYRSIPYGIRAKISSDNGKTWSQEIHLRDDVKTWDIGYTRSVQRADGKVVTIYYYTTDENVEQHIAATIWDPDQIK